MIAPNPELDNITGLAKRLGIDRLTLLEYLGRPDAPPLIETRGRGKYYEVGAVETYVRANAKSDRTADAGGDSLIGLKKRRLSIQCEREQIALEADQGKYFPKSQVIAEDSQIHSAIKAVLQRKLVTELPARLHGKTVADITEEMRAVILEICKLFRDRGTWKSTPEG